MLGNILPPYHSLQELNLDWILGKIKNILRFVPDDGAVGQILRRTPHGAEWSNESTGAVDSVNGQTGTVVLDAADVGALPDTYTAPVDSVNGQTGAVALGAADVGALPAGTLYAGSNAVAGPAVMSNALHWGAVDATSTATVFTAQIAGITSYYEGLTVVLRNGVATSTTNCTLNINGLGALPIYPSTSSTRVSTAWSSAYTMIFVYTENKITGVPCWEMQYGMAYSNSIGYQLRTNSARLPMSDVMYRYRIMFTSADGTKYVPANSSTSTSATSAKTTNTRPIDPHGAILYYGTTSSVAAGSKPSATNIWQQYVVTLGYSFNNTGTALTLTVDQPVYLRCAPQSDGSAVMEYFTQQLPSTDDGKIYIFLGLAASATTIELVMCHPVYYWKSGAIRIWTNAAAGGGGAVDSVNGQTGTVVLDAADVGALPDSYVAPVTSVNGQTGTVVIPIGTALDAYPVGSIYMSVNNTNPSTLFGGTWEQLENRFLLGAGSDYTAGATGGEAEHVLIENELPLISGSFKSRPWSSGSMFYDPQGAFSTENAENILGCTNSGVQSASRKVNINIGGGQAHNNMPPYLAVYMWKRTA